MKANELMIGDWVFRKNRYVQIADISGVVFSFGQVYVTLADCNDDKLLETHDIKSISPIPLTPEILEKNGWYHGKFDGSYGRKAMRLDGPYKDKLPDGVDNALSFAQWSIDEKFEYHLLDVYLWKGSVHLWIEYVHELQHIFRLCGIEKEVEL